MKKAFIKNQYTFEIGLVDRDAMESIFPIIEVLNPGMVHEVFLERLREMLTKNYNCIGIWHEGNIIACCGFWVLVKFYNGRHVEPDNVGVLPAYRNFGLGQIMMDFLHEHARSLGCVYSELNAYVTNYKAHKFYYKDDYKVLGFHFQKPLY